MNGAANGLHNPAVAVLDAQAALLRAAGVLNVVTFTGAVPQWTPPEGVLWMEMDGEWKMTFTGSGQ